MLLNERGSRPRSDPTRPAVSDRVAGKGAPSAPVSLAGDDHIVEWRQGWIRRWRVDGDERPIPAFGRLRRAITVGGMSTFSYSSPAEVLHFGNTFLVADLPRVLRLEGLGGGLLCTVYSTAPG